MMSEKYCLECFSQKNEENICLKCKTKTNNENNILQIKRGVILGERYIIGRVLGQGGFGITYLALDLQTKQKVAVKEFFPSQIATRTGDRTQVIAQSIDKEDNYQKYLKSFIKEIKLLSGFKHQNIVEVIDLLEANNTAYMIMPYLEGITLKEYLAKQPDLKLDVADMLNFMMPVLDGLVEVHKKGIVHRDISPDNIYITKEGVVKILDFGAARQTFGAESLSFSVILKEGFAPKEQYSRKGKQGPWTDIYAVAATICTAVTGKKLPGALDRDAGEELLLPSSFGISINRALEVVLHKALAMEPQGRYQNIAEFRQAVSMACMENADQTMAVEISRFENTVLEESFKDEKKVSFQERFSSEAARNNLSVKKDFKKTISFKMLANIVISVMIIGVLFWFFATDKKNQNNELITFNKSVKITEKIDYGKSEAEKLITELQNKNEKLNNLKKRANTLSAEQITAEMSLIKAGLPDISTNALQKKYIDEKLTHFFGATDVNIFKKEVSQESDELKTKFPEQVEAIDKEKKELLMSLEEKGKIIADADGKMQSVLQGIKQADLDLTNVIMAKAYTPPQPTETTARTNSERSYSSEQNSNDYSPPRNTQTTSSTTATTSYTPPPQPPVNNTSSDSGTKSTYRPPMRD